MLADVAAGAHAAPDARLRRRSAGACWRRRRGGGAAWIASGGSSPIGSLGYVSAGLELLEQIARGELPRPDVIYVALGSCGTAAGLVVGLAGAPTLPRLDARVVGVRVVDRVVANERVTRAARRRAPRRCSRARGAHWFDQSTPPPFCRRPSLLRRRATAARRRASDDAVARAAAVGLALEPTYTGKAMAALLADAAAGALDGKRVLFLNTYSSVDLAPLRRRAAPASPALPRALQRHFDAGAAPPSIKMCACSSAI